MAGTHALWSPSGAEKNTLCPGSLAASRGLRDWDNEYAIEGTRAHALAAWLLTDVTRDPKAYIGEDGFKPPVEMIDDIVGYVGRVITLATTMNIKPAEILVEQWVDCREIIPECSGTTDAGLVGMDELVSIDLKYGFKEVDAFENIQVMLYLLGLYLLYQYTHTFRTFRCIIDQPRVGPPTEFVVTLPELLAFADRMRMAAIESLRIYHRTDLGGLAPYSEARIPGVKQCRWCKALPFCKVAEKKVRDAMALEFTSIADDVTSLDALSTEVSGAPDPYSTVLSKAMAEVDFVERWCKAVRSETYNALAHGIAIPGWKMVQARLGNRHWTDLEAAEKVLKGARLKEKERFTYELISPTAAEALLEKEHPRSWTKAQKFIGRNEGGLSVAPESDKRPAYSIAADIDALPDLPALATMQDIALTVTAAEPGGVDDMNAFLASLNGDAASEDDDAALMAQFLGEPVDGDGSEFV
jgi:hypothetical protein